MTRLVLSESTIDEIVRGLETRRTFIQELVDAEKDRLPADRILGYRRKLADTVEALDEIQAARVVAETCAAMREESGSR